ncbi:MAG TPA: hypothetical protein VGO40_22610, partial [Longimicrobium sp.]|nr:hypothetical protein [Longimicrobium sp.]
LGFKRLIRLLFGADNPNTPLYMVTLGGVCLLLAAALVMQVHDAGDRHPSEEAVFEADEHELLTVQGSVQPVPSNALIDEEPRRDS